MIYKSRRGSYNGVQDLGFDYDIVSALSVDNGLTWSQGGIVNALWATNDTNTNGSEQDEKVGDLAVTEIDGNATFIAVILSKWNFNGKGTDDGTMSLL